MLALLASLTSLWSVSAHVYGDYAIRGPHGLAMTPPMGFNTWNHFGCDITQETILDAAKAMVRHGLDKAGYQYVIIDDCWHADQRDPLTNASVAHPEKFSLGIKHLSDEIHKLGLKFGIYSDAGSHTCAGRYGSLGFEEIDAATYAEWGVDYLKYDNCYNEGISGTPQLSYGRYAKMSRALEKTGRPILYAMCNWGEDGPWNWAATIAHSWRISGDICDSFETFDDYCPCETMIDCPLPGFRASTRKVKARQQSDEAVTTMSDCSVMRIIDFAAPLGQKAGPGHWNDLDMLEVGNGGMTFDEYVTHFSMWAIVKSPLILGNDLTSMSKDTWDIITNDEIIALNQDSLGRPARRKWKRTLASGGNMQLWTGPLANGDTVIAVLNLSPVDLTVGVEFTDVFDSVKLRKQQHELFDLWEKTADGKWGKSAGFFEGSIKAVSMRRHETKVYRAKPVEKKVEEFEEIPHEQIVMKAPTFD